MTALIAFAALMIGAALGYILAAMLISGRTEDECRACRAAQLEAAFRDVDGWEGTE